MWLIAIFCFAALVFAAVHFGFVPPPNTSPLLQVRKGVVRVARGQLTTHAREDVTEIMSNAGVSKGFIAVTHANHVKFSRHIPAPIHQQLRNVLLNQ